MITTLMAIFLFIIIKITWNLIYDDKGGLLTILLLIVSIVGFVLTVISIIFDIFILLIRHL